MKKSFSNKAANSKERRWQHNHFLHFWQIVYFTSTKLVRTWGHQLTFGVYLKRFSIKINIVIWIHVSTNTDCFLFGQIEPKNVLYTKTYELESNENNEKSVFYKLRVFFFVSVADVVVSQWMLSTYLWAIVLADGRSQDLSLCYNENSICKNNLRFYFRLHQKFSTNLYYCHRRSLENIIGKLIRPSFILKSVTDGLVCWF